MNYWSQTLNRIYPYLPIAKKLLGLFIAFGLGLVIVLIIFKITTVEIPILGFHDIIDLNNAEEKPPQRPALAADYTKQELTEFIEYLVEHNYWFLSSQELYDYFLSDEKKNIPAEHEGQKPIVLTFDDGYASAHKNLLAILEDIEKRYQQKVKVVWFINPAFLGVPGAELDHASCEDFRTGLAKGYYDLQSHGLNHKNLVGLSTKDLEIELSEAQRVLRECVQGLDPNNTVASHISYPFGAVNEEVEKYVAKYYSSAYLYNSRILRPAHLKDNYLVPRLPVYRKSSLARLKILAAGGWL